MRDPKRIKQILEKIEQIWTKDPDFRLMQLLTSVLYNENKKGKKEYKIEDILNKGGYEENNRPDNKFVQFLFDMATDANKGVNEDYFYIEDDVVLEELEKWDKSRTEI